LTPVIIGPSKAEPGAEQLVRNIKKNIIKKILSI